MESGVVRQVINGEYVISFTALIEELKTEFLHDENNLIEYDNDYFRVISLEEEHNSDNMLKVSCECEHISYDLIKQTKLTYTQTDRAAIYVMNDLLLNSGFNFLGTDVLTTASIDVQQETDIKSLLYLVTTIWGGELSYFQNDIELKQQLGINRGADFRFGKNIQNIKRLIDRVENTTSYEVEIVQGTELQELGYFQLGDTIKVVDDLLGIELETRIVEVEKDLVTGLNSRVILGQPIKDLSSTFNSIINSINSAGQQQELPEGLDEAIDKINNVVDVNGNLIASKLSGSLNTAVTKVQNSTGKVLFDDRGIITLNQPLESTSTKAVLITADGILLAKAKNADGTWIWRTAITADGISANEINTGTLSAININGVTITGSSITSDDANSEIKLNNGILSVKKKSTSQQFNINYRAGLPDGILQSELEFYNEFKADNPNKLAENTISLNSTNSHMGLEFGTGAVAIGNDWTNIYMYGGTFDFSEHFTGDYSDTTKYNPMPTNAVGSKMVIDLATTVWDVSKQYPGFIVFYSSTLEINAGYTELAGNLEVYGNFEVHGTKDCAIQTEQYGKLNYSAYETADIYLGDIGENEVVNGECIINFDEKLLACVNTDLPYQVFLTKYGQGDIWVEQRNINNFIVKGDNIKFGWEVKAKRKGYENIRFGQPK